MRQACAVIALAVPGWLIPTTAFGAETTTAGFVGQAVGFAGLLAAVILLVAAVGLQRVARGSAIADNISYVVGACVCLGASVLVRWVVRLVPEGLAEAQATLSSEVLGLAAIVLFSVYFLRVGAALRRFIRIAEVSEIELVEAQAGGGPVEGGATEVAREGADA